MCHWLDVCRRHTEPVRQSILYLDLHERYEPVIAATLDGRPTPLHQVLCTPVPFSPLPPGPHPPLAHLYCFLCLPEINMQCQCCTSMASAALGHAISSTWLFSSISVETYGTRQALSMDPSLPNTIIKFVNCSRSASSL